MESNFCPKGDDPAVAGMALDMARWSVATPLVM